MILYDININILQDVLFTWKNIMTLTMYNIYIEKSFRREVGSTQRGFPKGNNNIYIYNIQN